MIKPFRSIFAMTVATLLTVTLTGACASTRSAGEQMGDRSVSAKVKSRLAADPEVNPFNIDVDTLDGVVTLRGQVGSEAAKSEALKLAESTAGVKSVVDEIRIGERGMAERGSDAWIATKIKSKLTADPQINSFNIDVDVSNGEVTLSGRVRYAEAREEAEKLAAGTDGVTGVVNDIQVSE